MKLYIGITDSNWIKTVSTEKCEEVNFWKPGTSNFKALSKDDLFLFKLHAPHGYILGGGFLSVFPFCPHILHGKLLV